MGFTKLLISTLLLWPLNSAQADDAGKEVSSEWLLFQDNPKVYMNTHSARIDQTGKLVPEWRDSAFSNQDIRSRRYVELKAKEREVLRRSKVNNAEGLLEEEINLKGKVVRFLDMKEFQAKGLTPVFRLEDFDSRGLQKAELNELPWSGSYWPIYQGTLGARYSSRPFMELPSDWKAYYDYTRKISLGSVLATGVQADFDALSPSEKYDILIGVPGVLAGSDDGFLTQVMWKEGREYFERYGKVEAWMGICHGWAPAAFMVARPSRAIVAKPVPDRVAQVKLYPADMKGLISLLWAKGSSDVSFFGGRCNEKAPQTDPESGRSLQRECFDVNPGFWHVVLVNQIGLAKRSFIIDASFDYEVWNQPLRSYKYRYFNPQTGEKGDSAAKLIVKKEDYSKDKFRKFRSPKAVAYVGVEMDLTYVSENWNFPSETDDASTDAYRTVSYLYDLELDANSDIIGGEWYRNEHPDFVWLPMMDTRAISRGDRHVQPSAWNPLESQVPPFWREIAIQTARYYGEPLAAIIEPLEVAASRPRR